MDHSKAEAVLNEMNLLEEYERARADYIRSLNQLVTRARVAVRRKLVEALPDRKNDAALARVRKQSSEIVKAFMRGDALPASQARIVKTVPQMETFRDMFRIGHEARAEVEQKMSEAATSVLATQKKVRRLVRNLPHSKVA